MKKIVTFLLLITVAYNALAKTEQNKKGALSLGTGFLYNEQGDMFTNKHVIDGCKPSTIKVLMKDGEVSEARVIAVSTNYDLAALSTNIKRDTFASIRTSPDGYVILPEVPEDVFTAGFTNDPSWKYNIQGKWGQVTGYLYQDNLVLQPVKDSYETIARMDIGKGASGSPILDYSALLVGVVYGGHQNAFPNDEKMSTFGYGKNLVRFLNLNAVVQFANSNKLQIRQWSHNSARQDPLFIAGHLFNITGLIACDRK